VYLVLSATYTRIRQIVDPQLYIYNYLRYASYLNFSWPVDEKNTQKYPYLGLFEIKRAYSFIARYEFN